MSYRFVFTGANVTGAWYWPLIKVKNYQCHTSAPLTCPHDMERDKITFLQIWYCKYIHYVRS